MSSEAYVEIEPENRSFCEKSLIEEYKILSCHNPADNNKNEFEEFTNYISHITSSLMHFNGLNRAYKKSFISLRLFYCSLSWLLFFSRKSRRIFLELDCNMDCPHSFVHGSISVDGFD